MKGSRFSEEEIIGILRETEAGSPIRAVCAAHDINTGSYHAWKREFGGMEVSEAKRLRALEEENSRLARLQRPAVKISVQDGIGKVAAASTSRAAPIPKASASFIKSLPKLDGKLVSRHPPGQRWICPRFGDVSQGQIDELRGRFVVREVSSIRILRSCICKLSIALVV